MTTDRPSTRGRRPGTSSLLAATIVGLLGAALAVAAPATAATGGPVPADDAYTVDYETTLTVPEASGVLANDDPGYEADLDIGLYDPSTLHGTISLNGEDGSFAFTPAPGFYGVTSFQYKVGDTDHYSARAGTVTFTVRPVGSRDDAYRLGATQRTLTVAAPGVAGNDPSAAENTSTQLVSPTSHGTTTLAADGSFTYTPTYGFAGVDTFTYVVVVAVTGTTSYPATVTITVDPPNADLGVTITAPPTPAAGKKFTVRVTLTGTGPSVAPNVVVGVDVGRGLTVTAAPGGAISTDGRTVGYTVSRLAVGDQRVFALTVAVPADPAAGRRTLAAAVRSLTMVDFVPANDRATVSVRPRVVA